MSFHATRAAMVLYKPKVNRMVTYSLSPFQQKITSSLWKDIPAKISRMWSENVWDVAPGLLVLVGTVYWGTDQYHHNVVANRPKF
jgi:hypothetical protein